MVDISASDKIATITFSRDATLNAITQDGKIQPYIDSSGSGHIHTSPGLPDDCLTSCSLPDYDAFAIALREIDANPDILVTVWQGEPECNVVGLSPFLRLMLNTVIKLRESGFARMSYLFFFYRNLPTS